MDNILHIIDTLNIGGAQQVVKVLFEKNSKNLNMHLLAMRLTNPMIKINHPNVRLVNTSQKWSFRIAIKNVVALIKEKKIKLIHCHLPKSQLIGLIVKRFYYKNIKLVFHEQGDIIDKIPANMPGYLIGAKLIDKIICCSNFLEKKLVKSYGIKKEKISTIYNFNSFEVEDFQKQMFNGVVRIGFAGRFIKRKGWREFLTASNSLVINNPDLKIELHVAGSGPEEDLLLKELKNLSDKIQVKYYGFVENMPEFYKNIHILCVPSHWEPLGMVHIEAMTFNVAVIASDVDGMNELLKNEFNSLLFEAGNYSELENCILKLISNKSLFNKIITNAKLTAIKYSYLYFEAELNKVYLQLINFKI